MRSIIAVVSSSHSNRRVRSAISLFGLVIYFLAFLCTYLRTFFLSFSL